MLYSMLLSYLIESIKFKFPQYHDHYLQKRFPRIFKLVPIAAQADDEESPAKGDDDDDEADGSLDDPLGDGVEHDAEPAPEEGIPPNHEDDLYPGNTN